MLFIDIVFEMKDKGKKILRNKNNKNVPKCGWASVVTDLFLETSFIRK